MAQEAPKIKRGVVGSLVKEVDKCWWYDNIKIMSKENIKRNQKMYQLRKKGLSFRQLAKIFGINVRAVFDIVKRYERNKSWELLTGGLDGCCGCDRFKVGCG